MGARIHHASGQVDWQVAKRLWLQPAPGLGRRSDGEPGCAGGQGGMAKQGNWHGDFDHCRGNFCGTKADGICPKPPRRPDGALQGRAACPDRVSGAVLGLCVAFTSVGAGALGSVMLLFLYPLRMQGMGCQIPSPILPWAEFLAQKRATLSRNPLICVVPAPGVEPGTY